jgi:hypothetical protein
MRFVRKKNTSQQDVQALHRIRAQLIKWRTVMANEIRGLLAEYGMVVTRGIAFLWRMLPEILEDAENGLSGLFSEMLVEMAERFAGFRRTPSALRPACGATAFEWTLQIVQRFAERAERRGNLCRNRAFVSATSCFYCSPSAQVGQNGVIEEERKLSSS